MPNIDLTFITDLQADYTNYPNFIETGTYRARNQYNVINRSARPYLERI